MKKLIAALMAAGLIATVMIGCGNSGTDQAAGSGATTDAGSGASDTADTNGEDRVLTLLHYFDPHDSGDPYSVGFMALLDKFYEETGIAVNLETVPWNEIESVLVMTNLSGSPSADMSWVGSQHLASLVNAGTLRPLNDFFDSIDTSDFIPTALEAAVHPGTGNKYIAMTSVHSRGLWYNRELVDAAPANWDELIETAVAATDSDTNTFGFAAFTPRAHDPMELYVGPWAWSTGAVLGNDDGSAAWDNEGVQRAIQMVSDLRNVHQVMPESSFVSDRVEILESFLNGNIAMILEGTFAYAPIMESALGQSGNIGFAPIPGAYGPAPGFTNGWSMAIPSNSAQPELAMEFMRFMLRPDVQVMHSMFDGGLPILNESFEDDFFAEALLPEIIDNLRNNGSTMDPFVYYVEALGAISLVNVSFALDPSQDLAEMLAESVRDFNRMYYE